MDIPTLIDMSPVEIKYFTFMISINKCTGSCIVLSAKICVSKETKDICVKAFNEKDDNHNDKKHDNKQK